MLAKYFIIKTAFLSWLERAPTFMVPINPPFTAGTPLCHLVCHLPVQFNTDNTDNWNNTIHPNFLEIVDFSVSCWLCVLYEKARFLPPEDFKSLESIMRSGLD